MFPWIMWSVIVLAPFVVGGTLAFRTARRAGKADRAMRALAGRPGWSGVERGADGTEWAGYAGHFPWLLRTRHGTGATGPLGEHRVTVARRWEPSGRRDVRHWLIVCFEVPGDRPALRLERGWSAAKLGLRSPDGVPYLPVSENVTDTAERFSASDLPQRLIRFAGPAVSVSADGVCFVHPMPDVMDMDRLLAELAALIPDLTALARTAGPEASQDTP
ncbi:hypothetical protein [Streptomyces griseoruber]|uniref:Uncharacterized protein n=1 Tax=Streptomyces griseoruber TaxID=1943 RepID=A0A101SKX9_9ACTN|nr:hypothetical protein [Streptomyces griseoruber]KUN75880.1 hypothetical protein AQJ64_40035 [Streptomyces griseoruber]